MHFFSGLQVSEMIWYDAELSPNITVFSAALYLL
jgi:hypothetical protein